MTTISEKRARQALAKLIGGASGKKRDLLEEAQLAGPAALLIEALQEADEKTLKTVQEAVKAIGPSIVHALLVAADDPIRSRAHRNHLLQSVEMFIDVPKFCIGRMLQLKRGCKELILEPNMWRMSDMVAAMLDGVEEYGIDIPPDMREELIRSM